MARYIQLVLATFFLASTLVSAITHQSSTPSVCYTYTCPTVDHSIFPNLGSQDITGDILCCSYPIFSHGQESDFYCEYSVTTGKLKKDHDDGFCLSTAVKKTISCTAKRSIEKAALVAEELAKREPISDDTLERQKMRQAMMKHKA